MRNFTEIARCFYGRYIYGFRLLASGSEPTYTTSSLAEPRLLYKKKRNTLAFAAYSANQSDYRKHVTSRNTPTRSRLYIICSTVYYTYYLYTCIRLGAIHSQNRRQAVYPFKKEQEKAILAFTQTRDVSVALTTSYGKSLLVQVRYKGASFRSSS